LDIDRSVLIKNEARAKSMETDHFSSLAACGPPFDGLVEA
jgi:hypothetical protein